MKRWYTSGLHFRGMYIRIFFVYHMVRYKCTKKKNVYIPYTYQEGAFHRWTALCIAHYSYTRKYALRFFIRSVRVRGIIEIGKGDDNAEEFSKRTSLFFTPYIVLSPSYTRYTTSTLE